jgi:hypothetical protein
VSDNGFEPWKELIEQIKECIVVGKYQATIPALLSILEGYVIRNIVKPTGRDARSVRLLEHLKKRAVNDGGIIASTPAIPWVSASTFLDNLFKNSHFGEPAPSFINRHWILHGRSAIDWKLADALRLLTALDTLSWAQSLPNA